MNWKCVIVGLALVLPGTLFSVDGRNLGENSASRQGQLHQSLLNYFQQEGFLNRERYQNNPSNEGNPSVDKKPKPNSVKSEDAPSSGAETGEAGKEGIQEVPPDKGVLQSRNAPVEQPQALRLSVNPAQQGPPGQHGVAETGIVASNVAFVMVVAGCTVLAAIGIVGGGVFWHKYHKSAKAASVVEYPAYGVTGPGKDGVPSPGDRKLAHSAQMYHYQHQKQQMIATMQMAGSGDMKHDASDDESGEDNEEADYTVYECPGLAPTGEMEVKNPLFCGDETPSTPVNDEGELPPSQY